MPPFPRCQLDCISSFLHCELAPGGQTVLFFVYKCLEEQDQKIWVNTEVISSFPALTEQEDPPSLLCSVLSTLHHILMFPSCFLY